MSSEFKYTKNMIEWRRNTVLQKLSQGFSQSEIAKELKLHPSTISLDCQWLKETAQQNLHDHVERIPQQYEECRIGYKTILRRAYEISCNPNSRTSEILQSLSLISDIYERLKELSLDEKTLLQAISWIENKKKELQQGQEQEQQYQQSEFSGSEQTFDGESEELIGEENNDY
jgi:IS30 family transposase